MKPVIKVVGKNIFILEDDERRISWFLKQFRGASLVLCRTAGKAKRVLEKQSFDFYFLDRDLGIYHTSKPEHTGEDVASFMAHKGLFGVNTVIHSWNEPGAKCMKILLPNAYVIPFGMFEIDYQKGE